jgi:hypothetical protein
MYNLKYFISVAFWCHALFRTVPFPSVVHCLDFQNHTKLTQGFGNRICLRLYIKSREATANIFNWRWKHIQFPKWFVILLFFGTLDTKLRPLVCWDCGFESRRGHGCLSLVSLVCCQVEFSATGWSFVQRSPTECGVSNVCDRETSKNEEALAP